MHVDISVAPVTPEAVPLLHGIHTSGLTASVVDDHVPALQAWHDVELERDHVPAPQWMHDWLLVAPT